MNNIVMIEELKQFMIDELLVERPIDEIGTDMLLGNDLNVDSLGFTELMAYLENKYQIQITDEEFVPDNFRNIDAIVELVNRKTAVVHE
ncbi:acyl carrier protein [Paenibacillus sp. GCM10027627]|uniref:acyl carrier protein n=1 Tax=unclassified Paenibacillus TaxID=185978 RepID=UPI0036400EC7